MTDGADQVVTLQFISGNASRGFPNLYFKLDPGPELLESIVHGSKCNYVDLKDGAGGIARSRKGETIPVVAQLGGGSQSVTWFVPKPLVRQILFHVAEKKRRGNDVELRFLTKNTRGMRPGCLSFRMLISCPAWQIRRATRG